MIDAAWYQTAVYTILAAAPLTVLVLVFISAPYGRHGRGGWGPELPGRVGWFAMEWPTVLLFGGVFASGANVADPLSWLFLAMWMFHYVHRTFIFPFRLHSTKPIPLLVALIAMVFQSLNSYANAAWVSELGDYSGWLSDPRLWIGVAVFAVGQAVNLHADTVLIGLRKPGETGYKIPTGGMYRYVTNANYLGELLIWTGWAIATWSLAGVAFAVYTAANLVPRAATHHTWYQEKFGDEYPPERRRLIPFLW